MLKTGTWRLAERNSQYVVLEVYRHAAYAYLWHKTDGVRAHVWLFNCRAEGTKEDDDDATPPAMSPDNTVAGFSVPSSVDEISCFFNITDNAWDLYWAGRRMATLRENEEIGRSAVVLSDNGLAKRL